MMKFINGDIFESNVEAIVNTVNTKGVMGKGLALEVKKRFPLAFEMYKKACDTNEVNTGEVQVVRLDSIANPHYIINFPTKKDWKHPSKIEYIESGLVSLLKSLKEYNIKSIAIPSLGCGNGGLEWSDIKPLIIKYLDGIKDIEIIVFEPNTVDNGRLTSSRAAVLRLFENYCTFGDELTLLEAHKLAYFLQEFGEPLNLKFEKQVYGPYSPNLASVLKSFNQHFISMKSCSNNPKVPINLLSNGIVKVLDFKLDEDVRLRLEKVLNLVKGYQSSYGLELLATVHWLVKHEDIDINSLDSIMIGVERWNVRKAEVMRYGHVKRATERLKMFI